MKVYALVGKSGTGKSYQAMNVCREKGIVSIIDDGLFIYNNLVRAGVSAKKQPTMIGAIKTALFTKDDHRQLVCDKIDEIHPASILVIGTSDEMVEKIRKRLFLPSISETVYIDDITTPAEREMARKQRNEQGKHVIPAPTFQIKKEFSGYFVDPLQIFRGTRFRKGDSTERSVVRPTFSYRGDYIISDKVLSDIVTKVGRENPAVNAVLRVTTIPTPTGVEMTVMVAMNKGHQIIDAATAFQRFAKAQLEEMTAFNVEKLDVDIRGLRDDIIEQSSGF